MIPLRLALRNFMCYRDPPPLDLRGLGVVCLSGRNGHGKSALLDAITWALWGGARGERYGAGRRSQDSLVHQGQDEMWVELDFEVLGKGCFRVFRRYVRAFRGRNPVSELHLYALGDGTLRSLDGNSLRETEQRIQDLVGLDYETFVQTAFLLQNGADRFMQAGPADRKRRLGEVLGISYYERLRERVREALKRLDYGDEERPGIRDLERDLEDLEKRASQGAEWRRRVEGLRAEVRTVTERLDALRREREALLAERESLTRLEEQARRAEALAREARQEAEEFRKEAEDLARRLEASRALLAREEEVAEAYRRWQEARRHRQALDEVGVRWQELQQKKARLEQDLVRLRAQLEERQKTLRRQVEDLEREAGQEAALAERLAARSEEREALAQEAARLEERRSALAEQEARILALRREQETLKAEMQDLRRRLDLLQAAPEPVCPLCGHPLGQEGMEHLRREFEREGRERRARYDRAGEEIRRLAREVEEARKALSRAEQDLRRRQASLEQEIARLQQALERAHQARRDAQTLRAELTALEERLRKGEDDPERRAVLAALEADLARLGYDPDRHRAVRRQEQELEWAAEEYRRLQDTRSGLPDQEKAYRTALERARRREEAARQAEEELQRLRRDLERLPALDRRLEEAEAGLKALEGERERLLADLREAEVHLRQAEEAEEQARMVRERLQALRRERSAWALLDQAFSPSGVPLRLIDAALPQLEAEANRLLSRLTGGRLSLRIQTQRETRSGGVQETLDLLVADEWGTRPYELFSGGEAFRINFALRVALSRLLARRRIGAPLPVLFIDEGFGTQDAEGRERILEAIQTVREDFRLVVVITHIEELRDLFPARIEVEKTFQGSRYSVTWG